MFHSTIVAATHFAEESELLTVGQRAAALVVLLACFIDITSAAEAFLRVCVLRQVDVAHLPCLE